MRKLLLTPFLLLPLSLNAQQRTPPAEHDTALPVTHVSLYKNGVGFFEHTGHVTGNAAVTLSFNSGQLNDVLQSLTAIDLNGGRISGAGYNSTTPLDQQLKNLPITLAENPTAADFYAAIRGARVEVRSGTATINGRLLSVETRSLPSKSDDPSTSTDRYFITVVADSGEVRTLELTAATSVRLTDTNLHTDVTRYLQLLDSNRSQGLRHLTIEDHGTGQRELKVSYISEVPIWKSTYRILFTDTNKSTTNQTATLQGWSVVDNTTGTDWQNVQLSLIAGAPQSFIQPLSQPIYSRRPEIPIAQETQLTPQTFEASLEERKVAPPPMASPMALGATSEAVTVDGASDVAMNGRAYGAVNLAAPRAKSRHGGLASGFASAGGIMGGMAGGSGSGPAVSYEDRAEASIQTNTQTAAFDDFFAYNLSEPVTILKNESALVPILQTKVTADRVTLVHSDGYNTSQPLRALWLTNTSGLTLDRGSFSIVENGNFGGEGLLDPIHAGEKRLLSYAADQAVHVAVEDRRSNRHLSSITASKGVIIMRSQQSNEITYKIHNSADTARTVVLEHPIQQNYKLDSTPAPEETTASLYRFRVEVPAGGTTPLRVAYKGETSSRYTLTNSDDNQLTYILNSGDHNPQLEAAIQTILEARRHVADAQTAVDQTNTRLKALHDDEERQRANITALATADKASRDRFVHDLNTTEDNIKSAQTELAQRQSTLDAAKADLSNRIQNLQLDVTL